jgi:NTP pyrophosphatase (non-canonical NTP hydrolase)
LITAKDIEDMDDNNIMWQYYNQPTKEKEDQVSVMEMVKEFSKVLDQKPDPILYLRLITEEYQELMLDAQTEVEELKELADLVYVIYGYANARRYDLDEALRRVHVNNLGRCIQPDGSIHRREDGKIIKNKDYPKVKLDDIV